MYNTHMGRPKKWFQNHWGDFLLVAFLGIIILFNWHNGSYVLGNDTYAPELNPSLSLKRSIETPAWRSYRALGVPSDSEQADVVRTGAYYLLHVILPNWMISEGFVMMAFFVSGWGMSMLSKSFISSKNIYERQIVGLIAGILYATSLVAAWLFASPLHPFLVVHAFLPLVLWRLKVMYDQKTPRAYMWFFLSLLPLLTSAMVPTSFIVVAGIIVFFTIYLAVVGIYRDGWRVTAAPLLISLVLFIGTQLFWVFPFITYVGSNAPVLARSYINRGLTPNLIENEVKYNTLVNVPRMFFAWMDVTNDDGTKQYPFASWFYSPVGQVFSYFPLLLATIGIISATVQKRKGSGYFLFLLAAGIILLVGVNPPFGFIFQWLQNNIPLFKQVFRWQSSKLFPLITIPMAIFGAWGVAGSAIKLKKFGWILLCLVLCAVVVYSHHFFQGQLINGTNIVSVSEEYLALKSYLENNDPDSRIYIAPESNTLYFRSYAWGFFGSSFLNYLIPNPIVEKALTTSSLQSEDAQFILERLYNTRNPKAFVLALRRYNVPLVLYDKKIARLHNGYPYDVTLAASVLENNPDLSVLWRQGSLVLYRVTESEISQSDITPLYDGHDWRSVNTAFALAGKSDLYASMARAGGQMYPLLLDFDKMSATDEAIIGSVVYHGPTQEYIRGPYTNNQNKKEPVTITFDKGKKSVSLGIISPQLYINSRLVSGYDFTSVIDYPLSDATRFVSIGSTIVDLNTLSDKDPYVLSEPFNDSLRIIQWSSKADIPAVTPVSSQEYRMKVPYDAVIESSGVVTSNTLTEVNICMYSSLKYRCVNSDHAIIVGNKPRPFTVRTNELIDKDDTVSMYLRPVDSKADIQTSNFVITTYRPISDTILTPGISLNQRSPQRIMITNGDTVTIQIPRMHGFGSYNYVHHNAILPPVYHASCGVPYEESIIRLTDTGGITFVSLDCTDQVTVLLPLIRPPAPDWLPMMYWQGTNSQGIPLILSMYKDKSGYHSYENMLPYEKSGFSLSFFPLTDDAIHYKLDLYSYGVGRRESVNVLDNLSFQMIPPSWYMMRLVPIQAKTSVDTTKLFQLNEAYHSGWRLGVNNNDASKQPVRVNGWEQGWLLPNGKSGQEEPFFSSTTSVWVGYGVIAVLGLSLLLWQAAWWVRKIRT
jgi:hypothetical protein